MKHDEYLEYGKCMIIRRSYRKGNHMKSVFIMPVYLVRQSAG